GRGSGQHTRTDPDVPEATKQGCVEGKGHRTIGHLQRAEWSESTLMASLPNALQLVARSLPLVKLPLSDLSPALQATHLDLPILILYMRASKHDAYKHAFSSFTCERLASSATLWAVAKRAKKKAELANYASKFASQGGKARARALSPEKRRELARQAALARWSKVKK